MHNLLPHFIQEQFQRQQYEGSLDALTMFVDVSGFTPIPQKLMAFGNDGAEVLASVLNGIFDQLRTKLPNCSS